MTTKAVQSYSVPLLALGGVVFLCVSAVIFQAWMAHGADIFLTYAEAGLSWCL